MSQIGFFACWMIIGLFVVLTVSHVADKYIRSRYGNQVADEMDKEMVRLKDKINDDRQLMPVFMTVVSLLIYMTGVCGWPVLVAAELLYRNKQAKEVLSRAKGES